MAEIEMVSSDGYRETMQQRREQQQQAELERLEREQQRAEEKKQQQAFIEAEKKRHKAYTDAARAAWEKAAKASSRELFNADSGKVERLPELRSADKMHSDFLDAFKNGAEIIPVPDAIIKGGKLNLDFINEPEHYAGLSFDTRAWNVVNTVKIADDPCFEIPKGVTIYASNVTGGSYDITGRYWMLQGNALYMAMDKDGQPVKWNYKTEGYKAKQARLKAEAEAAEAERKRLAALEAERLEAERQEKQLETLKQLPAEKFRKLLNLLGI